MVRAPMARGTLGIEVPLSLVAFGTGLAMRRLGNSCLNWLAAFRSSILLTGAHEVKERDSKRRIPLTLSARKAVKNLWLKLSFQSTKMDDFFGIAP